MENYIIRILEKLFIIYFLGYFLLDLMLFLIFLFTFRKDSRDSYSGTLPAVSIIVPAYNEDVSIVNCVKTLRLLDYPDFEIIVVNDGSSDRTMDVLKNAFDLKPDSAQSGHTLKTREIRSLSVAEGGKLRVIDKLNGGKADSINAGISAANGDVICTIDADSVLDRGSLKRVVTELVSDRRVFVSGGQIAVSNDSVIENGRVVSAKMPSNPLVLWQITEYIKSFLVSRIGLSKINSILIMSGAFSVFRKADLMAVGGFLTSSNDSNYIKRLFGTPRSTVCEDMEIVVRLWRYYHETGMKAKAVYLPKPLCWTEVPDSWRNIFRQRARWHLGLAESLSLHRAMAFDPRYKATGLLAMPFYFFFELLSPVIKILSLIFVAYVASAGLINMNWVILMAALITLTAAVITSVVTVFVENWSEKHSSGNRQALRYKSFGDWLKLIFFSILSDFSFAFFRITAQIKGLSDFVARKSEWNKFERKGLKSMGDPLSKSTTA